MRYVLNRLQNPIFLNDIRKVIPYDPTGRKVFPFSDEQFERSAELREKIGNGAAQDISEQYAKQIEESRQRGTAVSPYYGVQQQQTVASFQENNGAPQPFALPRTQSVMIDVNDASRALGASDAAAHAAHIDQGIRPNGETGFLVDPYDDPNVRQKAINSRTAYLVDNDSKAAPQTDPRFYKNEFGRFNPLTGDEVNPVVLNEQPQAPMQHLYQTAQRQQRQQPAVHEHNKNDPNWGQHSVLLEGRLASSPTMARPHDHASNPTGYEPLDARMMANAAVDSQPMINPLLNESQPSNEVAYDENVNPLAADIEVPFIDSTKRKVYRDDEEPEITEIGSVKPEPKKRKRKTTTAKKTPAKKKGARTTKTAKSNL
jgi:hypothetical protein